MLTGTTLEVIALLAVLAVVHAVVSTFITRRLVRNEQASVEIRNNVLPGNFARSAANDQFRKVA
jgi:hypothetical protein